MNSDLLELAEAAWRAGRDELEAVARLQRPFIPRPTGRTLHLNDAQVAWAKLNLAREMPRFDQALSNEGLTRRARR